MKHNLIQCLCKQTGSVLCSHLYKCYVLKNNIYYNSTSVHDCKLAFLFVVYCWWLAVLMLSRVNLWEAKVLHCLWFIKSVWSVLKPHNSLVSSITEMHLSWRKSAISGKSVHRKSQAREKRQPLLYCNDVDPEYKLWQQEYNDEGRDERYQSACHRWAALIGCGLRQKEPDQSTHRSGWKCSQEPTTRISRIRREQEQ